jgi:hypothetical protein
MSTKSYIIWYGTEKKVQDVVKSKPFHVTQGREQEARGIPQDMKRRNGQREQRLRNAHKSGSFAHFPVQVHWILMDHPNLTY